MKIFCLTRDIEFEGEKLAEVTIEKDTEKGEIILAFRAGLGSEKLERRSDSFDGTEAKFTYREKKEQAPQTEQAKT